MKGALRKPVHRFFFCLMLISVFLIQPGAQFPLAAETEEVGLSGIRLEGATPADRVKIRELLAEYRTHRDAAGPAYSHFVMGRIFSLTGQFAESRKIFQKIIDRFPKTTWAPAARESMAEIDVLEGNLQAAVDSYEQYLSQWKVTIERQRLILFRIATLYSEKLARFDHILSAYRTIAGHPEYRRERIVHYLGGFFKGYHLLKAHFAVHYYQRVVEKWPDTVEALESRWKLGVIFGFDLSDFIRSVRYLTAVLNDTSEDSLPIRRQAMLLLGLIRQYHFSEGLSERCVPYYVTLIKGEGTDEVRAAASFFLGRFFEDAARTAPMDRIEAEVPDPDRSLADLGDGLLREEIPPLVKAVHLYLAPLREMDDEFFAAQGAYQAAAILAWNFGRSDEVETIAAQLEKRFPDSSLPEKIRELTRINLPRLYEGDANRLFAEATRLYEDGEYLSALEPLRKIVDAGGISPEAEWAWYTMGRILEEDLRDAGKAIQVYEDFLDHFPDSNRRDKVRYQIARIHEISRLDYIRAAEIYQDILENSADQIWIFQAGLDLIRLRRDVFNKEREVEKIFRQLLGKVPARADEILYHLASLLEKDKKKSDAEPLWRQIVSEHPESAYFSAALDSLVKDRMRKGLSELDQQINRGKGDTAEVGSLLARKLEQQMQLEDYVDAARTLDRMKEFATGTDEVQRLRLERARIDARDEKKAEKAIEAALDVYQLAEDPELRDQALYFTALTWEQVLRNWSRAADAWDLLIARGTNDRLRMRAMYRRGVIAALKERDFDRAYELYRDLLVRYPDLAQKEGIPGRVKALLNLDVTLLLAEGIPDTAEAVLDLGDLEPATGTAEDELLGGPLSLEDARPQRVLKFGSWFHPIRISRPREGQGWFVRLPEADPGFWHPRRPEPGWFQLRAHREVWDRGSEDKEILRQEQFLEQLRFESNLPPVESPKTVYYLDWLRENATPAREPIVRYYLGKSYEEANDLGAALKVYGELTEKFRDAPEAGMAIQATAVIQSRNGQFAAARDTLRSGVSKTILAPERSQETEQIVGAWEKVFQAEQYADLHPGEERALTLLREAAAIYEKDLKDEESAVSTWNRLASQLAGDTREVGVHREIIRIALRQGDLDLADREYRELVQRFRDMDGFDDILHDYAVFLQKKRKDEKASEPYWREIVDYHPASPHYAESLRVLEEMTPEDAIEERRVIYEKLREAAPEMEPVIEQRMVDLDVRMKIRQVRELIDEIHRMEEQCGCSQSGCDNCGTDAAPERFNYYKYLAALYMRELEDPEGAAGIWQEMLKENPPSSIRRDAVLKLGDLLAALGKEKEAAELYRTEALEHFNDDPDFAAYLHYLAAGVYESARMFDDAEEAYRRTSLYFPFSRWARSAKTAMAGLDDRKKSRVPRIKKPRIRPKHDIELTEETTEVDLEKTGEVALKKAKKPEERLKQIYEEVDVDPRAEVVPALLVEAAELEKQLKQEDRMMENYQRVVDEFPEYRDYYNIVFKMAEEYKKAGNTEEAAPLYRKIVDEQPQFVRIEYVLNTLGNMYQKNGDFIYAQEIFKRLIDSYQDEEFAKEAQFQLGVIRETELQEYDEAIVEYRTMADRYFDHPKAVDALIRIATIYETVKNDYASAQAAYQEVLDKYPDTGRRRQVTEAIERMQRLQQ